MVFKSSGVEEGAVDVVLEVLKSLGRCRGGGSAMLGNPAGVSHLGCPTPTPAAPTPSPACAPAPAFASARSNSINSFGPNNDVMCRYYSISWFEAGSGGNRDRS